MIQGVEERQKAKRKRHRSRRPKPDADCGLDTQSARGMNNSHSADSSARSLDMGETFPKVEMRKMAQPTNLSEAALNLISEKSEWTIGGLDSIHYCIVELVKVVESADNASDLKLDACLAIFKITEQAHERRFEQFKSLVELHKLGLPFPGQEENARSEEQL